VGTDNKIYVNENDLHDYEWEAVSEGSTISAFDKKITQKTLPLRIIGADLEEKNKILNNLFQLGEKDVLTMKYGKLIVGEYYLKCYVTGAKKKNYLKKALRFAEDEITVTTDYPWWTKEVKYSYVVNDEPLPDGEIVTTKRNLDYNFDYNIDYLSNRGSRAIYNPAVVDSNFKLIMYGACENPQIKINGHLYQVNVTLIATEYVVIDSVTKTITKHNYDGTETNVFSYRNKESYIFQRIAAGVDMLIWDGTFRFDLILYDERSEPVWT
jgi:hypothetical protein